jgi:hypothetical protein
MLSNALESRCNNAKKRLFISSEMLQAVCVGICRIRDQVSAEIKQTIPEGDHSNDDKHKYQFCG